MDINQLTASRIKDLRNSLGIKSQTMADELGIAVSNYSALENGKVEINLNKLKQIAQLFKMPLTTLIPDSSQNHTINISNGSHAINTHEYNNYLDKDLLEAMKQSIALMQDVVRQVEKIDGVDYKTNLLLRPLVSDRCCWLRF